MPRSGFVLYSNTLWYQVKKLCKIPAAVETKYYLNQDNPKSSQTKDQSALPCPRCAHSDQTELERFAEANRLNNWEFNEWLHGKTGEPMGMAGQSWNAAMFILAYHVLQDNLKVF